MTELNRKRRLYVYIRSLLIVVAALTVISALVGVTYLVYEIRINQKSNKVTQQINLRLTQTIVDCTTPGGKCYDDSRSQTTNAVNSISQVVIATKFCGNQLPVSATIPQITACVQKSLGG